MVSTSEQLGVWKRRKLKAETDMETDGRHGNGRQTRTAETECNHVRPSETSCNTNIMAETSDFVSDVIVAAMDGGKDNPIEISSEDEDVDQR